MLAQNVIDRLGPDARALVIAWTKTVGGDWAGRILRGTAVPGLAGVRAGQHSRSVGGRVFAGETGERGLNDALDLHAVNHGREHRAG